jgi:L-ribulokinase
MHAAVAAGAYPDIHAAAAAMGKVRRAVHVPDEERARAYDALFAEYTTLHDYFGRAGKGGHQGGGNDVMHRLRRIRREALR